MENFNLEKQNALTKKDKSHEQKRDEKIEELCNKINENLNYFTTSSCAGRIVLVKSALKKVPNIFLYKTHDLAKVDEVILALKENVNEEVIYFRQEPCALHVACKTFEDAVRLLKLAKESGWKRSGIFSTSQGKFVCELCSTEWIVAPLVKGNELLVNERYVEVLVGEANQKLEKTWGKIGRLAGLVINI